jgi:hypothetical protein
MLNIVPGIVYTAYSSHIVDHRYYKTKALQTFLLTPIPSNPHQFLHLLSLGEMQS